MGPLRPKHYMPKAPPSVDPVEFDAVKGAARTDVSATEKKARRRMMMRRFAGRMSPLQQGLLIWVVMIVLGCALALAAGGKPDYARNVLKTTTGELALYGALAGLVLGLPMFIAISRRRKVHTPNADREEHNAPGA